MKKQSLILGNLTYILGILATIYIIYNMLAVQIFFHFRRTRPLFDQT